MTKKEKVQIIIERLKRYSNTHVRAQFIAFAIKRKINIVRNDLFDLLGDMSSSDISDIAQALLLAGEMELYKEVKAILNIELVK